MIAVAITCITRLFACLVREHRAVLKRGRDYGLGSVEL